jgi:hypothetical protein
MKSMFPILSAGLAALLAGCAATPVVVAPVAPNPAGSQSLSATGRLQVFSSLVEQSDDQNQAGDGSPFWYQHSDYSIYTPGASWLSALATPSAITLNLPMQSRSRPGSMWSRLEPAIIPG